MARIMEILAVAVALVAAASAQYSQPDYHIYAKTVKKAQPTKKVTKKPVVIPVVAQPTGDQKGPFNLDCQVTKAGTKMHIVNCKVYSNLNYPVCVHLGCVPMPQGPCKSGPKAQDCSWNVVNGCSSPTPLYPGGAWSFGYMTSTAGPISITPPALGTVVSDAINGTACPR